MVGSWIGVGSPGVRLCEMTEASRPTWLNINWLGHEKSFEISRRGVKLLHCKVLYIIERIARGSVHNSIANSP